MPYKAGLFTNNKVNINKISAGHETYSHLILTATTAPYTIQLQVTRVGNNSHTLSSLTLNPPSHHSLIGYHTLLGQTSLLFSVVIYLK